MSYPGWCEKHNYRSQTTDAVCPQCKRERESAEEIERLWERIEELELQDERMIPDGCCLVTTEQIDAAWGFANNQPYGGIVKECLHMCFGIVRCEGCKDHPGCWSSTSGMKCPDCNGHGWVIGGEDE